MAKVKKGDEPLPIGTMEERERRFPGKTAGQLAAMAAEAGGTPEQARAHLVVMSNVRIAGLVRRRDPEAFAALLAGEFGINEARARAAAKAPDWMHTHPAADLFPMMNAEQSAGLKARLATGYRGDPIVLHADGRIIDGRNRAKACAELGIEPPTRVFAGSEDDILDYVLEHNLDRRQLSPAQRGVVVARVEAYRSGITKRAGVSADTAGRKDTSRQGVTRSQAAVAANVGTATVGRARRLVKATEDKKNPHRKLAKRLLAEVETGTKKLRTALDELKAAATPPAPEERAPAPAGVRLVHDRDLGHAGMVCHLVNRLAEIAEQVDPGVLRAKFPEDKLVNLDRSLLKAADFLAGLRAAHFRAEAMKDAAGPAAASITNV